MMKYVLVLLAILHLTLSTPLPDKKPIESSILKDLLGSLNIDQMKSISHEHLANDTGFKAAIKYFKSEEWQALVENVRKLPDWMAYKDFLRQSGIDLNPIIEQIYHCLNATDSSDLEGVDITEVKPNLTNYINDLKKNLAIPIMKSVMSQMNSKSDEGNNLRAILAAVGGEKSKTLLSKALTQPEMMIMIRKMKEMGVNIEPVISEIIPDGYAQ